MRTADAIATDLRTRLLDAHASARVAERQRQALLNAARERHDAIDAELTAAKAKAGTDEAAAREVDQLLDERMRCARLAALP